MTTGEWLGAAEKRLMASGSPDPRADAEWIMCASLDIGRAKLGFISREALALHAFKRAEAYLSARETGEPLQYVLGYEDFYGVRLRCDSRALIPRPETELLCERALAVVKPPVNALDMCTGTGALAIALKLKRPFVRVTATDISPSALSLARENGALHSIDIEWLEGDLFAPVAGRRFDLIMCNPPYLSRADMEALQPEVAREPSTALYGGEDGLQIYRRLTAGLPGALAPNGTALIELGAGQAEPVRSLAEESLNGSINCINIYDDLAGIPRVIEIQLRGI